MKMESQADVTSISWWDILKWLAFEGGPSSTKWVYLAMNATIAAVVWGIAGVLCYVYIASADHHVDGALLTALVALIATVSACALQALNHRRTVNAQVATGQNPVAISDTPLSEKQPEA